MNPAFRIRLARPDDCPLIPTIEAAADQRFQSVSYWPQIQRYPAITEVEARALQDRWRLWVAATRPDDRPVGFARISVDTPEILHFDQVSVHPDHAGNRLTPALLAGIEAYCGGRGSRRVTLTTFRDVPWNAPYYRRLGFAEIPDGEADADPHLGPRLREQVGQGLPRQSRIAMLREVAVPRTVPVA